MNEFDPEQFEAELQTLRPARPPQRTVARLLAKLPTKVSPDASPSPMKRSSSLWPGLLRWLIPAAAATVLLMCWWRESARTPVKPSRAQQLISSAQPLLKADKVEIDRQLVANFDAVGKLPSGEPVRFHCRQWMEKIWLRDTAKGLVIEQTTPHLEIVPIRFETD